MRAAKDCWEEMRQHELDNMEMIMACAALAAKLADKMGLPDADVQGFMALATARMRALRAVPKD